MENSKFLVPARIQTLDHPANNLVFTLTMLTQLLQAGGQTFIE